MQGHSDRDFVRLQAMYGQQTKSTVQEHGSGIEYSQSFNKKVSPHLYIFIDGFFMIDQRV